MKETRFEHNPDFKVVEFDQFRNQAGNNSFKKSEILELKKSTSELKEAIISVSSILNKHLKFGDLVTENQQNILKSVANNPHIMALELASVIGISEGKIKENIRKLKQKGLLRRIGAAMGGYWKRVGK